MTGLAVWMGLTALVAVWALLPGMRQPGRLTRVGNRGTRRSVPVWLLGAVATAATLMLLPQHAWTLAATAAVVGAVIAWTLRRGVRERARLRARTEVVRACAIVAGQLEIGEIPARALQVGAQDCPLIAPVAAAQAIGGDAPAALRLIGAQPGCAGLVDLADSWQLCERTGMPLAVQVRRVADAIRAEADNEAAREAELSSARSTGRLMVVLPGVGMMLGYFVDADPLGFLFGTWPGQLCLLGAAVFAGSGIIWTQRLSEEHQ